MSKERKEARIIAIFLVWGNCGRRSKFGGEEREKIEFNQVRVRHYEKSGRCIYHFTRMIKCVEE